MNLLFQFFCGSYDRSYEHSFLQSLIAAVPAQFVWRDTRQNYVPFGMNPSNILLISQPGRKRQDNRKEGTPGSQIRVVDPVDRTLNTRIACNDVSVATEQAQQNETFDVTKDATKFAERLSSICVWSG